jgi:uncharacterized protein YraI
MDKTNWQRRFAVAVTGMACLLPMAAACAVPVAGAPGRAAATVTSSAQSKRAAEVAGTVIDTANVRAGPGMTYDILTSLPLGASVTIACASGEWLRLASPREGGYVYHDLLQLQGTPKPC